MKNKRFIKCILLFLSLAILAFSAAVIAYADTVGTYVVAVPQTDVLADAETDADFVCAIYKGDVVEVTEVRLGYGKVHVNSLSLSGWVNMDDLQPMHSGNENGRIVRLEILSMPEKQTYIVGEETFDSTGLVVLAVYDNNDRVEIRDYILYEPSMHTVGEKKVTVSYGSVSETFTVTVTEVPIERIVIEGSAKKQFAEGQTIDFTGLCVRVVYSDGRPEHVFAWEDIKNNSDFVIRINGKENSDVPLQVGSTTVDIYYMYEKNAQSYTVDVVPARPQSLQVVSLPDRQYFFSDNRTLDLTGLVLNLIYNNGKKETVGYRDCEIIFDAKNAVPGENEIVIRYKDCQTSIMMEMRDAELVGIELTQPGRTVYIKGALFDGNDTVVSGVYDSGERFEISGWEVHGFDTSTCGKKTVEIRYGEYSVSFTLYVTVSGYFGGDVNLDGALTPADARTILRHAVGLEKLSGTAAVVADRDEDEQITTADARLALRAAVGLDPLYMDFSKTK